MAPGAAGEALGGELTPREIAGQLQGVVLKDSLDDAKRVRHYLTPWCASAPAATRCGRASRRRPQPVAMSVMSSGTVATSIALSEAVAQQLPHLLGTEGDPARIVFVPVRHHSSPAPGLCASCCASCALPPS